MPAYGVSIRAGPDSSSGFKWFGPSSPVDIGSFGRSWVRIGGAFGASAVVMGMMAKVKLPKVLEGKEEKEQQELMKMYEVAHRLHLTHAVAILALPLVRHPCLTGGLWIGGVMLASGGMYCRVLTGKECCGKVCPVGGAFIALGWLSAML
ncbi:PREDICTED: transmembrane protein 256-like [Priapulus caudatus]|uniref:Transmembrane protein 256-like n=1 Tax=Priapulus caudatus TaxID=37621 RepID=A0ABM1E7P6_PRICU|nr:PREDICTED: transmembrane protein 256-like [Priapulus caudatus]